MSEQDACAPSASPANLPDMPGPVMPIDGMVARLVEPDDYEVLTDVRTTDMRTAMARGLKEYFERLELQWTAGRLIRFKNVLYVWADGEKPAEYPSMVVLGNTPMTYSENQYRGQLVRIGDQERSTRYLKKKDTGEQRFEILIWCSTEKERQGFVSMCEDGMEPLDEPGGLVLELPYYFGARANYAKASVSYQDGSDNSQKRWWMAKMIVNASLDQYVPVGFRPFMDVHVQVEASEDI